MPKNNKEKIKYIVNKFAEKWIKENKELFNDYQELCSNLFMFQVKWGIEIGFIFKNSEEVKGCKFGYGYSPAGITEELFDAQIKVNSYNKKI